MDRVKEHVPVVLVKTDNNRWGTNTLYTNSGKYVWPLGQGTVYGHGMEIKETIIDFNT